LTSTMFPLTLGITGFLCILNLAFAYVFRKRNMPEISSYVVIGLLELAMFVFTLALRVGILHHTIPLHLPPHLPFNRAEIGAALAIGIGLFPAAFWHRTSAGQLRARMTQDAKVLEDQGDGVHVRSNAPGEWLN
jgi:hypothetical protein